ncbi:MAG: MATE family efflux transporter [Vicinamibacterales bacterium]
MRPPSRRGEVAHAMQDLTTGPILRHLVSTGGFMLFTMAFQTLYFLADLYWMGRLGKEAVAAVGVSGNLMFVVLALTQMLGVGTTTLVAHAAGRKDTDAARRVFNQAQGLSMLAGVLFLVAGLALTPSYAAAFAADRATAALVRQFLWWFVPAMALQFAMVALAAALRGIGDFKPGMVVQSATVALNIALAPVLIFGWGTGIPLGVGGAGAASLVAVVVGVVWLSRYVERPGSFLHFRRAEMPPDAAVWKRLLGIGLPAGVEFALIAVYMGIVYAVSRPFGAAAQAGFGIGQRVVQAGFMPIVALAFAVAPVAGQNFGARLAPRVRETFRVAAVITVSGTLVLVLLCHLAPAAMIRVFSTDPAVVAVGEEYLRIVSWNFVASGLVFVISSMFQAMGNTMPSLLTSTVRVAVVAVPAFVLARRPDFRLTWIWYLTVLAVTLQLAVSLWLLNREFARRLVFVVPPAAAPGAQPVV